MNQREIMQALLDGKKIKYRTWGEGDYCFLDDNEIVISSGGLVEIAITNGSWSIYEPPKQIKKKTMWRALTKAHGEYVYSMSDYLFDSIDDAKCWADKIFYGAIEVEVCYEE